MALVSFSLSAVAQTKTSDKDASKVSVFGGYSFLHYSNGTDTALYGNGEPNYGANANGFVASVAYKLTNTFAIEGEYGFYHAGSINNLNPGPGASITGNLQTYLFGPKASKTRGPVTPFVHVLFGGMSGIVKGSASGISVTGPRANGFAMALGGGFDWKATPHVSIRPVQFEYLMSRLSNSHTLTDAVYRPGDGGNGMQNNYRYSAGVVYNF
jgi:hypothetical protein